MARKRVTDLVLFMDILRHGPATLTQLRGRVSRSLSATSKAVTLLMNEGLLMVVAYGARAPGQRGGSTPRIYDVGPAVRAWAAKNIKPPREDE